MFALVGLERLPKTLAVDDPRLPRVELGQHPLRMNTWPLPIAAWGTGEDHASRVAAYRSWLHAACGDYSTALRRAVTRSLNDVTAAIEAGHDALSARLATFQGLYTPQDLFWSSPRPLPRVWWNTAGTWHQAELGFWTGTEMAMSAAPDFDEPLPSSPFRRSL